MRATKLSALALAAILCVFSTRSAVGQNLATTEWSSDLDNTYEPTVRDQVNDPTLDGLPPADWNDIRNGYTGVNEEDMVIGGVGYPAPDPGAATPNYGVLTPAGSSPGYWSPSSWDAGQTSVTFSVDIYADPLVVPNANGIPDGWWTNAVGPGYVTEAGITWEAGQFGPGTWSFSGGGSVLATVLVGDWYEMEVSIFQGTDGDLDATHSLWNSTHTVLLGSNTVTTAFLDPVNQALEPSYSWFVYFEDNMDAAFVDDFQVSSVPEPGTMALLGMGLVGMVAVARRRRRA